MALVAGDHIHFVTLNLTAEHRLGLVDHHALAQLLGHALNIILVQIQLPGDLLIGQVQSHEIQT